MPLMLIFPDVVMFGLLFLAAIVISGLVYNKHRLEQRVAELLDETAQLTQEKRSLATMNRAGVIRMTDYLNDEYRN